MTVIELFQYSFAIQAYTINGIWVYTNLVASNISLTTSQSEFLGVVKSTTKIQRYLNLKTTYIG